jgi:glycine cleavage system H protein
LCENINSLYLLKKVIHLKFPDDVVYSDAHLWAKPDVDGVWLAGITDYAQDLLGDIVFIDAPKVGAQLMAGKPCGLVESVKTGSDLHALVDGTVTAINEALFNHPEAINDKPYASWIFKFKPNHPNVADTLLDAKAYQQLIS